MGDRAVAGFREKSGDPTIFLYQHWVRGEQSQVLADALQRAECRWTDYSYATRICLSQMIGEDWNQELSYGVYVGGTSHGADYDYILIVEWESREVIVAENENSDNEVARIPFAEFIANPTVSVAEASLDFQKEMEAKWEKRLADLRASRV